MRMFKIMIELCESFDSDILMSEMTTSLRRESTVTFGRQSTTVSFGRQSTFDTIDDHEIVLTDEEKRKRQKIMRRGVLFLVLGFSIVLAAAGALGVVTYFNKKTWTKIKDVRYGMVLEYTNHNNTSHVTFEIFELLRGKKWIHSLHRNCTEDLSKPMFGGNMMSIEECLHLADKAIPAESLPKTPLYIINKNGSLSNSDFNTTQIQNIHYDNVNMKTRLKYHWLAINQTSIKKTKRTPWSLGWLMEKYSNATLHDGNDNNHVLSPVVRTPYKKLGNVAFIPSAVLFSCILMIGLILVVIGNAHL